MAQIALWKVYSASLRHTFPTHAFYEPEDSSNVGIGDVGYIDNEGNWNRLRHVEISDVTSVAHDWGVVHSANINKQRAQGSAS